MAEIGFYHLTRTSVAEALPPLLGRTLAAGERAVVRGEAARIAALDASLWLAANPDWLPHGTAATGFGPDQPIWLTPDDDVPNDANFLFLLDDITADFSRFDRVFYLFDGNDTGAVTAARARWKSAKDTGHALTYWQQGERGWVKQAS
ncbi:MAG TPA: DNA polymerase III subunit chi [Acidiphilium sp.]